MNLSDIQSRYRVIVERINTCATKYQRPRGDISLLAVSKRHSQDKILSLLQSGHTAFGENYLQEALAKMQKLSILINRSSQPIANPSWHFIGHIQSRKCQEIAQNFDWVHTVENLKVAKRLNQYRSNDAKLKVLIQLNLQQESSKSGISKEALPELIAEFKNLPNLELKGLMIIPRAEADFDTQRKVFRQCATLLAPLTAEYPNMDQLSMGMSDDMDAAIAEGATWIRIGSAIFGARAD